MMVSANRDIRTLVGTALRQYPWLKPERGGCHWHLRSERSRDFVPIPFSPSDFRAPLNLRTQIRRLAETGRGLIAAKGRR